MNPIIVKEVLSRKEFNQFISLPHEIHKSDVNWLSTLYYDDRKAYERIMRNSKIKIIEFRTRKEIKPYIIPGLELMNETYAEQYGYVSMAEDEKQDL